MAKINTEKPMGKNEQKRQTTSAVKKNKEKILNTPVLSSEIKKEEISENEIEKINPTKTEEKKETEEKTQENKKEKKKVEKKVKKDSVFVNVENLSVSTKVSASICKFIKYKKIDTAIKELEEVSKIRKAIPMKGEYAHRKGKIMSGKFPVNASKEFIILLKSLKGNANNHDVDEPVITEAFANKGTAVWASGGRKRKRTHIKITATQKKLVKQKKENKK